MPRVRWRTGGTQDRENSLRRLQEECRRTGPPRLLRGVPRRAVRRRAAAQPVVSSLPLRLEFRGRTRQGGPVRFAASSRQGPVVLDDGPTTILARRRAFRNSASRVGSGGRGSPEGFEVAWGRGRGSEDRRGCIETGGTAPDEQAVRRPAVRTEAPVGDVDVGVTLRPLQEPLTFGLAAAKVEVALVEHPPPGRTRSRLGPVHLFERDTDLR